MRVKILPMMLVLLVGLAGLGARTALAGPWVDVATVSTTAGSLTDGRLCSNDGRDLLCNSMMPYVSPTTGRVGIGTLNPNGMLSISSSVSGLRAIHISGTDAANSGITFNRSGYDTFLFSIFGTGGIGVFNQTRWLIPFVTDASGTAVLINSGAVAQSPSTTLHVSGTLRIANGGEACDANRAGGIRYRAGNFEFCSGAGWATLGDLAGATADRITSGTTTVVANNGGPVSFTVAGVNVANFGSGGLGITSINASGLVQSAGVSSSGPISSSAGGYFAGNVGIGTQITSPSALYGAMALEIVGTRPGDNRGTVRIGSFDSAGAISFCRGGNSGNYGCSPMGMVGYATGSTNGEFVIGSNGGWGQMRFDVAGTERMRILTAGQIGINTATPTTALNVSGTLRIANGGEACDANRAGGIRYRAGNFEFCSGVAWTTLGDLAGATADRITSGTTTVVANNGGPVSFTVAGVNVANFGSGGLGITSINASGLITAGAGVSATYVRVARAGGACSTAAHVGNMDVDPTTGQVRVCRQ